MKNNIAIAIVAVLCFATTLQAQDAATIPGPDVQFPQRQEFAPALQTNGYSPRRVNGPMSKAVQELKKAKTDEEKQAAQDAVKVELEKLYDVYLAQNEKQLQQLEERLVKLRDQLEKRKQAKEKLVDLRLQMMISEAEGLGWPGNSNFGNMNFRSPLALDPFSASNPIAPNSNVRAPRWPNQTAPVARPELPARTISPPIGPTTPKRGR